MRLKLKQRRPHTCTQVHQTVMSHVDTVLQAAEPIAKAFETYAMQASPLVYIYMSICIYVWMDVCIHM